jgi:hypothetical protein
VRVGNGPAAVIPAPIKRWGKLSSWHILLLRIKVTAPLRGGWEGEPGGRESQKTCRYGCFLDRGLLFRDQGNRVQSLNPHGFKDFF